MVNTVGGAQERHTHSSQVREGSHLLLRGLHRTILAQLVAGVLETADA